MAGRLQISVLGELRVALDGRELPLSPSKKTRALLAYLAVAGRPQRRERLCELFWEIPNDPHGALRWSLSKIRQIVNGDGEERLKADRSTVNFKLDGIDLDFSHVAHLRAHEVDALDTLTLEALAGAFRGRFLDDLYLPRCPEFEAWRVSHADELDVLRLRILRTLVGRLREEPEHALVYLHALQNLDPEDATLAREAEILAGAARQRARTQPTARSDQPVSETPMATERPSGPDELAGKPNAAANTRSQEFRFCTTPDGVRIAYALSGTGPPIVRAAYWMSHLQFDWESPVWRHWIDGLSERNTLIRYDERGNGLSDWDVADLSFETMIADLESVVDAAGLERFTLLGVSQSCAVSVAYAVRHPERVLGLVLYGGYVKGWRKRGSDHEIATREALATLVRQGWNQNNPMFRQFFSSLYVPNARPDQIAWFDELQRRTVSPENAWRLQNAFGDIDVSPLLSEVAVPTLVLHAPHDAMVPFESGRALATGIPGARFVELDSANHILVQDEPAFLRFLSEVRAFVSANEASRDPTLTADQTRKRITVLAAEIISPLLAFEEADPEVAMNAIDPLLDLAVEVVGHHGGTVVSRGQADLTAIFGAPTPAEDHARQACRAALAMTSAVEQAADGASRIRASLDTGEAIVRIRAVAHGSRVEVNGAPVRLVRQLTQSLRRNVIAATDRTREAAGGFFWMEPLARSEHPSFARDLRTHAVLGENKAFSRWQMRAERGLTRLIARDAELQLLSQACPRAREGHGQVIGIVADPGMGKSRLAHELLTSDAIDGFTVLEAGAFENEATASFRLIGTLLRAFFAIDEQDTAATAAGRVSKRLGRLDADARMGPPLMFVLGLPIQDAEWASLAVADRARRVRDAVAVLLTLEARRRPVVVLVEDLHWIDPESEAVLNRVVEAIRHQRVLLIATSRTGYRPPWAQTSVFSQLRLEPLGPAETDSLLCALLGDDPSVAGLIPLIAARADGMPLFMEEAVRALVQRSALAGKPGHYIAQEDIRDVEIPPNVLSVIAARVDLLPEGERRVLQAAAVIGREIPLNLLGRVTGLRGEALDDKVRRLQEADLLYESQTFPARRFALKHTLVEKVTYESILAARRRDIHARFIEIVEAEHPELLEEFLEHLAEHALRAEAWDKAVRYLLRSAQKALQRSAHNAALSHLQRGLEILAGWPETPERLRIELEYQKTRGLAWMAAKGWGAPEVSDAYERAEVLCSRLDDRAELFTVLRGRAQYYMISGQPKAAQELSRRCVEITDGVQDDGIAIETHHMFWTNGFFMGDCTAATEHADRAIERYDPDRDHALTYRYSGHDPGVCCRCFSGLALWQQGKLDLASARCREALTLAERFFHPLTTALACWGLSYLHLFRREPEAALQWAEREIEICDEYLLPLLLSQGLFQAGWAAAQLDDPAGGLAQMERGLKAIRATGAEMGLPYFLCLMAECHAASGDPKRALAAVDEALGSARRNGAHFQLSEMLRVKAEVTSRVKGCEEAQIETLFRTAVETARGQGALLPELRAATGYARYLTERRRRTEATDLLLPYAGLISDVGGSVEAKAAAEFV